MRFVDNLKSTPWHIAGITIFFITHGYSEYTWLIPVASLLVLWLGLLLAAYLVFRCCRLILITAAKAGLLATFLLAVVLFFGAIQDLLAGSSPPGWLSRYRYLLPLLIAGGIGLFAYLKRSNGPFTRITLYLNTLFLVLIVVDVIAITGNLLTTRIQSPVSRINLPETLNEKQLKKPDIFLIVMDEYSGTNALRQYFHYDNTHFENSLRNRGFFVAGSPSANYPATLIAMASLFSMDTIHWLNGRNQVVARDYSVAKAVIDNSEVITGFQQSGYRFYNYSIIDIGDQPALMDVGFIPVKLKLLLSKTLIGRIGKDFGGRVTGRGEETVSYSENRSEYRKGMAGILAATRAIATKKIPGPKFVYTHLLMPHPPFLADSTGKEVKERFSLDESGSDRYGNAYLQYLVYTNTQVWQLVNDILTETNGQSVILLVSDHGDRGLPGRKQQALSWSSNFLAAYLPGNDYRYFYDSISNVNLFPVLLNSLFHTDISLLPDSCIFDLQTQ